MRSFFIGLMLIAGTNLVQAADAGNRSYWQRFIGLFKSQQGQPALESPGTQTGALGFQPAYQMQLLQEEGLKEILKKPSLQEIRNRHVQELIAAELDSMFNALKFKQAYYRLIPSEELNLKREINTSEWPEHAPIQTTITKPLFEVVYNLDEQDKILTITSHIEKI